MDITFASKSQSVACYRYRPDRLSKFTSYWQMSYLWTDNKVKKRIDEDRQLKSS